MKYFVSFVSVLVLALMSSFALSVETSVAKTAANKPVVQAEASVKQGMININTADVEELTQLKGIGTKKAEAIVAWRKENGSFKSVEQLTEVKGIGEATLTANRANIQI